MNYLDVTNTYFTGAKTGIQRVVRRHAYYLEKKGYQLVVSKDGLFWILDDAEKAVLFDSQKLQKREFLQEIKFNTGDCYVDLDATWGDRCATNDKYLYLKDKGVIIISLFHDTIPLDNPEFCHKNTTLNWLQDCAAKILFADMLLVTNPVVKEKLINLSKRLKIKKPVVHVIPLGCDIPCQNNIISPRLDFGNYCLFVGTIEPRKGVDTLLESFDRWIDLGIKTSLVIVGKIGWDVEELKDRIKNHRYYNKYLFWLDKVDDEELSSLYTHCEYTINLSHNEGYGLPIVESILFGKTPVCTPINIFKYVSQGLALHPETRLPEDVAQLVKKLHDDKSILEESNKRIKTFKVSTWEDSAFSIHEKILSTIHPIKFLTSIKQAVFISKNINNIKISINHIIKNLDFISELVILVPDFMEKDFKINLSGFRININIIKESDLLDGSILSNDHSIRNSILRSALYKSKIIDENFLAFDDDYIVFNKLSHDFFIKNGRHSCFYHKKFGNPWLGAFPAPTSFDVITWKTQSTLASHGYSADLYNSHMPQPINKTLYGYADEMFSDFHLDEWSMYFNVAQSIYPNGFDKKYYRAAGWPQNPDSWTPDAILGEIDFINYYPEEINNLVDLNLYINEWRERTNILIQKKQECDNEKHVLLIDKHNINFSANEIICRSDIPIKIWIKKNNTKMIESLQINFFNHKEIYNYSEIPSYIYVSAEFMASNLAAEKGGFFINITTYLSSCTPSVSSMRVLINNPQ